MTLLEIASQAGMTQTELKKSIIQKVELLEELGVPRKEAEKEVKEAFFAALKGE